MGVLFPWLALGSYIASSCSEQIIWWWHRTFVITCVKMIPGVCYYSVNMLAAVHHPSLSWQAEHDGSDTHIRRVCAVSALHHLYSSRAYGNPAALLHICKLNIFAHTDSTYCSSKCSCSSFFSVSCLSMRCSDSHPPLFCLGESSGLLSSAECDVMQIFAVSSPAGKDVCCSAGLGLGLSHAQTPFAWVSSC